MNLSTHQAAFLYLLIFNIGEAADEKYDDIKFKAEILLQKSGRVHNPVYDHDGYPLVQFPDLDSRVGFNYGEWVIEFLDDEGKNSYLELCFNDPNGVDLPRVLELIKPQYGTEASRQETI